MAFSLSLGAGAPRVQTGLDRLLAGDGPTLRGESVCVLTHPAGVTRDLHSTIQVLDRIGARIVSILGPEHGLTAAAQDMETVADEGAAGQTSPQVKQPGVPVYSLYGDSADSLHPLPEMFHGAKWLVCDLQDIGSRYYTFVWTVVMAAEAAAAAGLQVLVLDRPNPIGGTADSTEGGTIEAGFHSFVGFHSVAVRHGMTLAELVCMTLAERGKIDMQWLAILECSGWNRRMLFSDTGLPWVLPSPNMPTLETALVYPGQCLLEGTLLSEGRGTTKPFEFWGAPWIDCERLMSKLSPRHFPGLGLRPVSFKPMFQKHAGELCHGVALMVREPWMVRSLRSTWAILIALHQMEPGLLRWRTETYEFVDHIPAIDLLAGGSWLRRAVEEGANVDDLLETQAPAQAAFVQRRAAYLLYDEA